MLALPGLGDALIVDIVVVVIVVVVVFASVVSLAESLTAGMLTFTVCSVAVIGVIVVACFDVATGVTVVLDGAALLDASVTSPTLRCDSVLTVVAVAALGAVC